MKFKVGDEVKVIPTESTISYLRSRDVDINEILIVEHIYPQSVYNISCYKKYYIVIYSLNFEDTELRLCVKDNVLNRALYPELKPNDGGYLE